MSDRAPHIGIDARMATDAGFGTYLSNLVPRLVAARPDWTFTAFGKPDVIAALGWAAQGNVTTSACDAPYYSIREQLELPARVREAGGVDLFWAPHYNVPLLVDAPMAVTVHDVCHLALRESTTSMVQRAYARFMYGQVRRRARAILCDSEFTRREFERLLGAPAGEAHVVPLGVDGVWATSDRGGESPVTTPYFVYVGTQKRHKNIPRLLRAFARVVDVLPHRLVLVGRRAGVNADPEIDGAAAALGDRVVFAGEVDAHALRRYVVHADALVMATLYEGFGLPPLEAMAAGTACVVASSGSLPEVCGDAALYCEPRDEGSIARALVEIASNETLRASLVERGHARAREFTWDRTAATTLRVMERALRAAPA